MKRSDPIPTPLGGTMARGAVVSILPSRHIITLLEAYLMFPDQCHCLGASEALQSNVCSVC